MTVAICDLNAAIAVGRWGTETCLIAQAIKRTFGPITSCGTRTATLYDDRQIRLSDSATSLQCDFDQAWRDSERDDWIGEQIEAIRKKLPVEVEVTTIQ